VRCEVRGVGRSGFYDCQKRPAAPALSHEEIDVLERIKALAEKTHHSDGSRRLGKQLQAEGYDVGRLKGRRWMKQAGVSVERRRRRGPKTPESRQGDELAPHLRARNLDGKAPNGAWCGDITDIWTEEGW
jgi:transposase InsO family protein